MSTPEEIDAWFAKRGKPMKVVSDVRVMFGKMLIERNPREAARLQRAGEWDQAMEAAEASAREVREMLAPGLDPARDPAEAARVMEHVREHLEYLATPERPSSELS